MGQIIPRSMLLPQAVTTKLTSLKNELITLAAKETSTSPSEWVVRDTLPETDLGFDSEQWLNQTLMVPDAWTMDWNHQLPVNKFWMAYGIINHAMAPTIYGMKFKQGALGATTIDTIQFRKILEEDNVIGFFDRIIYRPQSTPYIELIANAATAALGEEFEILSMVCEKYGDIISGPKLIV